VSVYRCQVKEVRSAMGVEGNKAPAVAAKEQLLARAAHASAEEAANTMPLPFEIILEPPGARLDPKTGSWYILNTNTKQKDLQEPVALPTTVVGGGEHSVVVTANGEVISFGSNIWGQLGQGKCSTGGAVITRVNQLQGLPKCAHTVVGCGTSFLCIVAYNAMKRKKKHRNQRTKPRESDQ
jgi:hypothetical protein